MNRCFFTTLIFLICASLILAACAPAPTLTPEPSATVVPSQTPVPATFTPLPTATKTPRPSSTPRPTPTPNLKATAQVEAMKTRVQEYVDAGYISSAEGSYKNYLTHIDSWAQIGWYQWDYLEEKPSDFVLETDLKWTSASGSADTSGCGFVYHLKDANNYYVMYVSLKGFVMVYYVTADNHAQLGHAHYGNAAQNGGVHLSLLVEKNKFSVLIDGKFIKSFTGSQDKLLSGALAYTVFSGTNKDYGTRCVYENTELWTIKK